jgi:rRNA biogenesis protein RRP5
MLVFLHTLADSCFVDRLLQISDSFSIIRDAADDATDTPKLSNLFREGQLLTCVVTNIDSGNSTPVNPQANAKPSRRTVNVSLLPSRINNSLDIEDILEGQRLIGSVRTKEDHGWVIDLGIQNVSGFLPTSAAKHFEAERSGELVLGELLSFFVKAVNRRLKTITFTLEEGQLLHYNLRLLVVNRSF